MPTWRHFEVGARVRKLAAGGEERIGLDRVSGRPVTLRLYPHFRALGPLPAPIAGPAPHLAQPLELVSEEGEAIVARELAFGPSLEDLMSLGPQPGVVVSALLRQLLEGLAQLHGAGRAHLRLSPAAIRFDLLAGLLKIADLEQALLEPEPPPDLVPRYLEPGLRTGGPINDIYSVGRIGEALLRGGEPLGPWGAGGVGGAPGPLWDFIQRCQSPSLADRPPDAVEALAQLERMGLSQAPALTLPLSGFVRGHVRALRELRRWRAQPLPPLASHPDPQSYRELLSSSRASRLWGAIGVAALLFGAATFAVAQPSGHRGEVSGGFPSDTCAVEARPLVLEQGAAVPEGNVAIELEVSEGETVAIDGCLLRGEPGKPIPLVVARGAHELRATEGTLSTAESLEIRAGQKVAIEVEKTVSNGLSDATTALAHHLQQGSSPGASLDSFDPIETGMLDPISRELLDADHAVFGGPALTQGLATSDLPMSLGLALDGLRAARRRFDAAGTVCAAGLATAASRELGSGTDDSERAQQRAVELLTITRIRGAQLRQPLRTEKEALERLQVVPSRRVLAAVEQLSARAEIAKCLDDLAPKVTQITALTALAVGQLPGIRLSDEPADGDENQ